MTRHVLIVLIFWILIAWVTVGLLPWLVVGPKRLSLRVATSIGQILASLYDRVEARA
jgi:hypothetical protein